MDKQELLKTLAFNVVQGRVEAEDEGFDEGLEGQPAVTELVEQAIEQGIDPKEIVLEALTKSMEEVGEKFERDVYLIPDMLASAECVGVAMDILSPHLMKAGVKSKGTFVIATVAGDLHDIGKNIVAIMLKGAGYQIIDLGTDVSADRIIGAVKENEAPFIGPFRTSDYNHASDGRGCEQTGARGPSRQSQSAHWRSAHLSSVRTRNRGGCLLQGRF